jgi:hypothetical protein
MGVLAVTELEMDLWEERAAIMEFDAGMTRFEAETKAAEGVGRKRWEFINENIRRNTSGGRNIGQTSSRDAENGLPRVQPPSKEEKRSVLSGDVQA